MRLLLLLLSFALILQNTSSASPVQVQRQDGVRERLDEYTQRQHHCLDNYKKRRVQPVDSVLVLSPGPKNIPLTLIDGTGPMPQNKTHSYPMTFSGYLAGQTCTKVIELPEMFTDKEMVENLIWLQKRCFKKVLIHLSKDEDWAGERMEAFRSFLKLFLTTYGDWILNNIKVVIFDEPSSITPNIRKGLENFFSPLISGDLFRPNSMFVGRPDQSAQEFRKFVQAINPMRCNGQGCIRGQGFMQNTPWIGHPSSFEITKSMKKVEVRCFSKSQSNGHSVTLVKKDEGSSSSNPFGNSGGWGDDSMENVDDAVAANFDKKSSIESKVLVTVFTIRDPLNHLGEYFCQSSEGGKVKSKYALELKQSTQQSHWSEWSEWSKCEDKSMVGQAKVSRTREKQSEKQSQQRFCRCSDLKELPRPRIVLLGRTGVGKSSIGNQLLGGKKGFAVGHGADSKTVNIHWRADHYLGYGECITVFDTPGAKDTEGRDYKHTYEMKKFLADEVKSVDIFMLLISGKSTRFDQGTQELLLWYEAVFGKEMWKHVVVETTFWKHTKQEAEDRKARMMMDEESRSKEWENKLHLPPFNVNRTLNIPFVFIDPVVDVFEDTCNPNTMQPSKREVDKFMEQSDKFEHYFNIIPFDCQKMCKAPPAIFSGMPARVEPKKDSISFNMDMQEQPFIEWHVLRVGSMTSAMAMEEAKIVINGKEIDHQFSSQGQEETSGLKYKVVVHDIAQKVISIKLYLDPSELSDYTNTFEMSNSKGAAQPVTIHWRRDAVLSPWTEWGACPITCIGSDGTSAIRTKTRECTEGINSAKTCAELLGANAVSSNNIEESQAPCPLTDMNTLIHCKVEPRFTPWEDWGQCSANCGPAKQTRRRSCVDGRYGGAQCQKRIETDERDCSGAPCPKHCQPGDWMSWSGCAPECYKEEEIVPRESRKREAIQQGEGGGVSCSAFTYEDERICMSARKCPIHGAWTEWTKWSTCSATCAGGTKYRMRQCNPPRYGGMMCQGESHQTQRCNSETPCRCEYSEWTGWSLCQKCGVGTQSRSRKVMTSTDHCRQAAHLSEQQRCLISQCPEGGSCVLGGSKILMSDYSTLEVQDIKPGDRIMDQHLQPVEVVVRGQNYLGSGRLYQLNEDGPVFTSEHIFLSQDQTVAVVSKASLLDYNPQIEDILGKENILPFDKVSQLLLFKNKTVALSDFQLRGYDQKMPPETPVYFILTSGQDGSYIVDNFVSQDFLPVFDLWPMTYATIGAVLTSPLIKMEPISSYEHDKRLQALTKSIAQSWTDIIARFDWTIAADSLEDFDPTTLWEEQDQLLKSIEEKGLFPLAQVLNSRCAKILHATLDNEKVPLAQRVKLMQELVQDAINKIVA